MHGTNIYVKTVLSYSILSYLPKQKYLVDGNSGIAMERGHASGSGNGEEIAKRSQRLKGIWAVWTFFVPFDNRERVKYILNLLSLSHMIRLLNVIISGVRHLQCPESNPIAFVNGNYCCQNESGVGCQNCRDWTTFVLCTNDGKKNIKNHYTYSLILEITFVVWAFKT